MRFPPSLLDEIRARLPVSQVVGRRVRLKRQGREYVGLSPFKHEKTPSFTVNDAKGFYHCFASGEHGDIFTFLTRTEGLSFPEAVERLAEEAGVPMPKTTPQAEAREAESLRLRKLMDAACAFFQDALHGPAGRPARDYLERRGLAEAEIAAFRLGYAPNGRHLLKEHLAARGFSQPDMVTAGVLIAGDDIPVSYDRFRHRLMFPIGDLRGQVIAFGGRALDPDQQPKYLNSPETPLFHKGSVLFNAAAARKAAHERAGVVVAEGYMDVIALTRAGIPNSVAPLGTALTPDQLKLLWRMADEPLLCFDGDSAGEKAALRAAQTALPLLEPGRSIKFAFLPKGQDPDDLLRNSGAAALVAALNNCRPLADVLWMRAAGSDLWDTPERRAALSERVRELLLQIKHPRVRNTYQQEFQKDLRDLERKKLYILKTNKNLSNANNLDSVKSNRRNPTKLDWKMRNILSQKPSTVRLALSEPPSDSLLNSNLVSSHPAGLPRREALLLQTLIHHPWLLEEAPEDIAEIQFEAPALHRLRDFLLNLHSHQNPLDNELLHTQLKLAGYANLLTHIRHAITHNSDWNTQPDTSRDDVLIGWRHMLALHRKAVELKRELEAAEQAYAKDQSEENYLRLQDIFTQAFTADGAEASVEGYGAGVRTEA
jgi:DNA primase